MIRLLTTCFILSLFFACQEIKWTEDDIRGIWVGQSVENDGKFPLPMIYDFLPTGNEMRVSVVSRRTDPTSHTWSVVDNTLRIDTLDFAISKLTNKELSLFFLSNRNFKRPVNTHLNLEEEQIRSFISKKSFLKTGEGEVEALSFGEDKVALKFSDKADDIRCWTIFEYGAYDFLVIKGDERNCTRSTAYFMQILALSESKMQLSHCFPYQGVQEFQSQKLNKADLESKNAFQACTAYRPAAIGNPIEIHKNPSKIAAIFKNDFFLTFKKTKGYININFTINCYGKLGDFDFIAMNQNYEEIPFVAQDFKRVDLMGLIRKNKGWKPYKREGEEVDTRTSIVLKIENEKVISVVL